MPGRATRRAVVSVVVLAISLVSADAQARIVVLGHSVEGRAIKADVIGPNSARRKILLVGCIHGNECAGRGILTAVARLRALKGVQLWLVKEMNPDGTAADTRQNAHGVDLNRNFPYQWQRVSNPTYYSGPHPASEPETRVATALILRIKPAVTIWYHQHEDLVDMAGGDRGVARRYAQIRDCARPACRFSPEPPQAGRTMSCPGRPRSSSSCRPGPSAAPRCAVTSEPWKRWSEVSGRVRGRAAPPSDPHRDRARALVRVVVQALQLVGEDAAHDPRSEQALEEAADAAGTVPGR